MDLPNTDAGRVRLSDWMRLRAHLLWAYHGKPASPHYRDMTLPPQLWTQDSEWLRAYCSAWLILKGQVQVVSEDGTHLEATAGKWVFPMRRQSHTFSPDAEIISIAFTAHWPGDTPLYTHNCAIACEMRRFPDLARYAWRLVRLALKMQRDPALDPPRQLSMAIDLKRYVEVSRALLSWIAAYDHALAQLGLQRSSIGGGDSRVVVLQQRIDTMPFGEFFDEAAAARSVGLSISQMNRVFVRNVGMTPRAYCQQRRQRIAADLLANTSISIKQISFMMGFSHPNSFSKWYRKHGGLYPRELRQRQAGKMVAARIV